MYYAKVKDEDKVICTNKRYILDLIHEYDYIFYHSSTEPFTHIVSYLDVDGSVKVIPAPSQEKMLLDILSAVEI